jgi:transcriptional regulator with XRE-family HTH domain
MNHRQKKLTGAAVRSGLRDFIFEAGRSARAARVYLGLSQEQVARLGGVSQGAVSRFEGNRGTAVPFIGAVAICKTIADAARAMPGGIPADGQLAVRLGSLADRNGATPAAAPQDRLDFLRAFDDCPEPQRRSLIRITSDIVKALAS